MFEWRRSNPRRSPGRVQSWPRHLPFHGEREQSPVWLGCCWRSSPSVHRPPLVLRPTMHPRRQRPNWRPRSPAVEERRRERMRPPPFRRFATLPRRMPAPCPSFWMSSAPPATAQRSSIGTGPGAGGDHLPTARTCPTQPISKPNFWPPTRRSTISRRKSLSRLRPGSSRLARPASEARRRRRLFERRKRGQIAAYASPGLSGTSTLESLGSYATKSTLNTFTLNGNGSTSYTSSSRSKRQHAVSVVVAGAAFGIGERAMDAVGRAVVQGRPSLGRRRSQSRIANHETAAVHRVASARAD